MPAMWVAPRLPATRRLRRLEISDCAVAKESAQAGRTLALFSLELPRQAFFPRGFHGPALSLELALRQSWSRTCAAPVVVPDLEAVRHVLREPSGGTSWDG